MAKYLKTPFAVIRTNSIESIYIRTKFTFHYEVRARLREQNKIASEGISDIVLSVHNSIQDAQAALNTYKKQI